jgi:PAS domain S-box-containing protein
MPNKKKTYTTDYNEVGKENFSISIGERSEKGINLYWMLDPEGKIMYQNSNAVDFLENESNINIEGGMVLHVHLPKRIGQLVKNYIINQNGKDEFQAILNDNNRSFNINILPLKKDDSNLGFAINIYCNSELIEEVEALKLKLKQNKVITDNLFDVVWIRKLNFKSGFISKSIFSQRGFTPEEYINLDLNQIMTDESAEYSKSLIALPNFKNNTSENPLFYFADYYRKDGSIMHGESVVYPIYKNGKIDSIYGITRDVTDQVIYMRKIKEQKSEIETVLNNTDEMIASIDLDYNIVTMNEANKVRLLNRYGKTPLIGDNILNYINPDNTAVIKKIFKQIVTQEKPSFQHIFTTNYDNNPEFFETSIKPIIIDNDEIIGISVFVKDITEVISMQRHLEESESRLLRITDSSLEGIWEYNLEDNTLFLSHRLRKITGFTGENNLNEFKAYIKTVIEMGDYEDYKSQLFNQIAKEKPFNLELLINIDGTNIWLQIKAYVTYNLSGKPQLISGLMLDITERKIQETALRIAKENAEEMNKLKSSFIANMSHEVRTPLNGILGVTQYLEEMDLSEDVKYFLKLQKESGFRLLDTINNIMSLSRLEAKTNQQELQSFDLNLFIQSQLGAFEIMAKQKNILLSFIPEKENIMVPLNEHLFYQVFNNLVGNAIKFTNEGSVKIYTNANDNYAIFKVVDTGIGIEKENLDNIFEAFVQESTGTGRKYEGSGLGLAIAKKYVEWSGGNIKVESKKGKGSEFTLNLPLIINNH